jgi:hypothetical protein
LSLRIQGDISGGLRGSLGNLNQEAVIPRRIPIGPKSFPIKL